MKKFDEARMNLRRALTLLAVAIQEEFSFPENNDARRDDIFQSVLDSEATIVSLTTFFGDGD